jgi:hypothetical protein
MPRMRFEPVIPVFECLKKKCLLFLILHSNSVNVSSAFKLMYFASEPRK